MIIKDVDIPRPDDFSCAFRIFECKQKLHPDVLIVAFAGIYPEGEAGATCGRYMAISAMQGIVAFDPCCVVLDLSDVTYTTGNELFEVFQTISRFMDEPGEMPFPILVVTSDSCREAFLQKIRPNGGNPPAWHFHAMTPALEAARTAATNWLDS